jgi:hypothetical protein
MTKQSEFPGLHGGMFMEVYIFAPTESFKEEDLAELLQFFDGAKGKFPFSMLDHVVIPHPQHFDGRKFKPQPGLTISEVADILVAMEIKLSETRIEQLPEELRDQIDEDGLLCPFDDITLKELLGLLVSVFRYRLNTDTFNMLSRRVKRQFLISVRDGRVWRFGDRQPTL